ncbi:MAG: VCBS repeat-containing protein [Chloroflexi bacterium]|nr:MAG: VCBS repeat-containing protein [Chloroflexota bacterium]
MPSRRTRMLLRAFVTIAAITLFVVVGSKGRSLFSDPVSLTTTHTSVARPAVADIDGDIDIDVVAGSLTTSLLRGHRANGFGAGYVAFDVTDASFSNAEAVAIGDIDLDGDQDVVAAARNEKILEWFENADTAGTLWIRHNIANSVTGINSILVTDIDRNGTLDVVAAGQGLGAVYWWPNNVTSWDNAILIQAVSPGSGVYIDAGDFDRDGDIDIAAALEGTGQVGWFENTSPTVPNWINHNIQSLLQRPKVLVAADINSDNWTDIAVVEDGISSIVWWQNSASGFGSKAVVTDNTVDITDMDVADFNGDQIPDFLVAVSSANELQVISRSSNSGNDWSPTVVTDALSGPAYVLAADINVDGTPDMLAAEPSANTIRWWPGSAGRGAPFLSKSLAGIRNVFAIAPFRDINNNGKIEVPVDDTVNGEVDYYEFDSESGLWVFVASASLLDHANMVAFADLDGDGDKDGFLGVGGTIFFNNGDNTFTMLDIDSGYFAPHLYGRLMEARDFDLDGDLDILAFDNSAGSVNYYTNDAGDGSTWSKYVLSNPSSTWGREFAVDDIDNDGDLDLWNVKPQAGKTTEEAFRWFENPGTATGNWPEHVGPVTQIDSFDGNFADVDLDGDMDFAGLGSTNGGLRYDLWWWENTDGQFATAITHLIGDSNTDGWSSVPGDISLVDVDGDLDPDVVFIANHINTPGGSDVLWYENRLREGEGWRLGVLSESLDPPVGFQYSLAAEGLGDVDGDGDLDAVLGLNSDYSLYLLQNSLLSLRTVSAGNTPIASMPGYERHEQWLFKITAEHRGSAADAPIRLDSLGFKMTDSMGADILSNFVSGYHAGEIRIYRDNGDGAFPQFITDLVATTYGGPLSDTFVGVVTMEAATLDGDNFFQAQLDGSVVVNYGTPVTLFAVMRTANHGQFVLGDDFNVVFSPAKSMAVQTSDGKRIVPSGVSSTTTMFQRGVPLVSAGATAPGYRGVGPFELTFKNGIVLTAADDSSTASEPDILTLVSAPAGITVSNIRANANGDISATVEIDPAMPLGNADVWFEVRDFYGFGYIGVTEALKINVQDPPPPSITANGPFTLNIGRNSVQTVATVTHPVQPVTSLTVNAVTVPTGIQLIGLSNNAGTVTATIVMDLSTTLGSNVVTLEVTAADGKKAYDSFLITAEYEPATFQDVGTITLPWNSSLAEVSLATVTHPIEPDGGIPVELISSSVGLLVDGLTNSNGVVTANVDASLMSWPGVNQIHLRATDAKGREYNLLVNVDITNSDPVFSGVASATTVLNGDAVFSTVFTVTDAEQSPSLISVTTTTVPAGLTVTTVTNNSGVVSAYFAATSPASYGLYSVIFEAQDSVSGTSQQAVTVAVINAPPSFVAAPTGSVVLHGQAEQLVVGTVADIQDSGTDLFVSLVEATAGLVVTGQTHNSGVASAWIEAPAGTYGNYPVTFRVTDSQGAIADAIYTVAVVNTPPEVNIASPVTLVRNDAASVVTLATVTDLQDAAASLTVMAVTTPANLTVTNLQNDAGEIRANIRAEIGASVGPNIVYVRVDDLAGGTIFIPFTLFVENSRPSVSLAAQQDVILNGPVTTIPVFTVSDLQDAAGDLQVAAITVPTGIQVLGVVNSGGAVTASLLTANIAGVGIKTIDFAITDSDGLTTYASVGVNLFDSSPTIEMNSTPIVIPLKGEVVDLNIGTVFDYQDELTTLTVYPLAGLPNSLTNAVVRVDNEGQVLFSVQASTQATVTSFGQAWVVRDSFGNEANASKSVSVINTPPSIVTAAQQTVTAGVKTRIFLGTASDFQTELADLKFGLLSVQPENIFFASDIYLENAKLYVEVTAHVDAAGIKGIRFFAEDEHGDQGFGTTNIEVVVPDPVTEIIRIIDKSSPIQITGITADNDELAFTIAQTYGWYRPHYAHAATEVVRNSLARLPGGDPDNIGVIEATQKVKQNPGGSHIIYLKNQSDFVLDEVVIFLRSEDQFSQETPRGEFSVQKLSPKFVRREFELSPDATSLPTPAPDLLDVGAELGLNDLNDHALYAGIGHTKVVRLPGGVDNLNAFAHRFLLPTYSFDHNASYFIRLSEVTDLSNVAIEQVLLPDVLEKNTSHYEGTPNLDGVTTTWRFTPATARYEITIRGWQPGETIAVRNLWSGVTTNNFDLEESGVRYFPGDKPRVLPVPDHLSVSKYYTQIWTEPSYIFDIRTTSDLGTEVTYGTYGEEIHKRTIYRSEAEIEFNSETTQYSGYDDYRAINVPFTSPDQGSSGAVHPVVALLSMWFAGFALRRKRRTDA